MSNLYNVAYLTNSGDYSLIQPLSKNRLNPSAEYKLMILKNKTIYSYSNAVPKFILFSSSSTDNNLIHSSPLRHEEKILYISNISALNPVWLYELFPHIYTFKI